MDTTTKLRLLLANIVADAGTIREVVASDIQDPGDTEYLLREVELLQTAAHRMIAFLDEDVIEGTRH